MSAQDKTLYLLRHAKSAWDTAAADDFSRPLNKRGERDAIKIGQWLQQQAPSPDIIVSSPALRAWQTATSVCHSLQIDTQTINFDRRLYLAGRTALCRVIAETSDEMSSLLLVGHNPGLDELLGYLVAEELPEYPDGKLMTTASLCIIGLPAWRPLKKNTGQLVQIIRPKSLS